MATLVAVLMEKSVLNHLVIIALYPSRTGLRDATRVIGIGQD